MMVLTNSSLLIVFPLICFSGMINTSIDLYSSNKFYELLSDVPLFPLIFGSQVALHRSLHIFKTFPEHLSEEL
jgi:hypothetical protein